MKFERVTGFFLIIICVILANSVLLALPRMNKINSLSPEQAANMLGKTWHAGCPVPISQLREVHIDYWSFAGKSAQGILIVNQDVAQEVSQIFAEIYKLHFPIQRVETMDVFHGDDNAAMAANNSSAFNCRPNVTRPNEFSLHSYGRAIDINTLINPYVRGDLVLPPEGRSHVARDKPEKGKIVHGDAVYKIFTKYGWVWGGDWEDRQDYQHFQKGK